MFRFFEGRAALIAVTLAAAGPLEAQNAVVDNVKDRLRAQFGTPIELPEGLDLEASTPEELDAVVGHTVYDVSEGQILGGISFRRSEVVGPKVSGELINAGVLAITLAIGAVLIYIWFRFEWQFGVGAVVALVHDVLLTIGFFSLTQLEFNLSIIAAILTIVGYSLNDTVVVYDRVRENLRRYRKLPLIELFNNSINEVLSRTIMTSVTTLLALVSLFCFGGAVIQGFTAAMIWGVFVGTYSSIFVAVPFLFVGFFHSLFDDQQQPSYIEIAPFAFATQCACPINADPTTSQNAYAIDAKRIQNALLNVLHNIRQSLDAKENLVRRRPMNTSLLINASDQPSHMSTWRN